MSYGRNFILHWKVGKVPLSTDLDKLGCIAKDEVGFRYTNAGGYNANVEDE